jgi:hypothetical protein
MSRAAPPMMGCGHAANSVAKHADGTESPSCVICVGIHPGADTIVEGPDLTGRTARCGSCDRKVPSDPALAFFAHRPDQPADSFYCGCRGWD